MSSIELKYKRLKRRKRRNIILNTVCLLIASSGLLWTINYFWRYISYEITKRRIRRPIHIAGKCPRGRLCPGHTFP